MADLRKMINDFTGADEEALKQKERLELLKNAAEAHLNLAKDELALSLRGDGGGIEGLYIVPDSVVDVQMGYTVSAQEGMDAGMKSAVDQFFGGSKEEIKKGFQTVVQSALSALFADTTAGEQEKTFYFVMMEHNAFVRVDLSIWKYYFTQKGITDQSQQAFCFVFVKSIIDHKKVSDDTMVYLMSKYVGDDLTQVEAFFSAMRTLYADLKGIDPAKKAAEVKKLMA